jgi:hypothetical protein
MPLSMETLEHKYSYPMPSLSIIIAKSVTRKLPQTTDDEKEKLQCQKEIEKKLMLEDALL